MAVRPFLIALVLLLGTSHAFAAPIISINGVRKPTAFSMWRLLLEPQGNFSQYQATDTLGATATIASKSVNPGLRVGVVTNWPLGWIASFTIGGQFTELQTFSTQYAIDTPQHLLWRINLGTEKRFNRKITAGLYLGLSKELFLVRSGMNTLSMPSLLIADATASARWNFLPFGPSSAGFLFSAGYLAPNGDSSVSTGSGFSYRGGIFAQHRAVSMSVYFEQRYQTTDLMAWRTSELGATFSINLGLGGAK